MYRSGIQSTMMRPLGRSRSGFVAVWVLLVLTVVPAAFVLLVDGAAVVDASEAGQAALASARAAVVRDPALQWSKVVQDDLPASLAPQAAVVPDTGVLTLRVPLPIPVRGVHVVDLTVRVPSARGPD